MIKRALAATLCLLMAFTLLPKTARAANATSVSIWGETLGGTYRYYHNGSGGVAGTVSSRPSTDANATFNPSTNPPTLTLNGLCVRDSDVIISGKGITYAIYANGDLAINVIAASEVSSTTNANSYAVYVLGDLTFTGTETLVATADNKDNAAGVYVDGDLLVKSGTLEGRVGIEDAKTSSHGVQTTGSITVDGGKLVGDVSGTSNKSMSFGVDAATILTVESGSLEGRSGAVSSSQNIGITTAISVGVNANDKVTVTGGTLTGYGNAATASYALSYGLCTKTLTMKENEKTNGNGTIKANGGAATGSGGGAYSAGVAVNGALSVSRGFLTAKGGPATDSGGATAQSSGVYAEAESISFSGGTVTATGGGECINSYGIKNAGVFDTNKVYISGGAITVSDTAVVTATGGDTMNNSYGLYCRGGGLTVSGGTLNADCSGIGSIRVAVFAEDSDSKITVSGGNFTAKANTDSTVAYALSKALLTGADVTAKGSTSPDGSNSETYKAASNFSYKWVSAKPTVTSVQVNPASVSVQKGGTQNFNATVMGADPAQTVSWAVEDGVADTRIGSNGTLTIAADETATSLTVRATSTVNTAISGTATVTVTPAPTVTGVAVNPASVSIQKGDNKTFSATVMGTNSPARTVTWSVTGGVTGTVIDANGKLTVAASETATSLTVKATSTVDTSKFGTAAVTVTAPTVYEITQGQHGQWIKGSGTGLVFTADGDYSKFTGISVDGNALAEDKYTAVSGSTVVTLKVSYLRTLSAGRHTLRINYTDGYAETDFIIPGAGDVPKTGDSATPMLWLGLALVACAGLAVSMVLRRKRQNG